jgi:AhpD family alkylhydroperoxidase
LWAQLAAARVRGDAFCVGEHRNALLKAGESEQRVDKIGFCKLPNLFSEVERAVIAFSETISVSGHADKLNADLMEVKRFFTPAEIQELSTSVLAVNEWIDIHDEKPVRVIVVEDNEDDQELLGRQLQKSRN